MDSYESLLEAFDSLNERKRQDADCLSRLEKARWRMMRCQIEEALFQETRDPATDTREFLRVPISLKVHYKAGPISEESFLSVLGEGGLFIAASDPTPKGTRIEMQGYPVGAGLPFRAEGLVVWSNRIGPRESRGMGIQFTDLSDQQRNLIHALVDDRVRQGLLERRRVARIDTRLEVAMERGVTRAKAQTHDLSTGGMFFATDLALPVGESIFFKLTVPGGLPTDRGEARVAHRAEKNAQGRGKGIGLVFVDLSLENEHVIRHYMRRRVTGEIRHPADEPRRHARLIRRTKVRYRAVNAFGTTDARDLSFGGAFIQNRQPPPLGSSLEMSLVDPFTLKTIEMSGQVVRVVAVDPKNPRVVPGVGVAFDSMDESRQDHLKEFLSSLAEMDTAVYSPEWKRQN